MNLSDEFEELFDNRGRLAEPTLRGNANLDVQDYQHYNGFSSLLAEGIQEDAPSTPGRNPGAAPATDIEGTDSFSFLKVPGGMKAPGMKQTTYGASPWGPGSESGYRPHSQARTDMNLRALGMTEDRERVAQAKTEPVKDEMHDEPEVIDAVEVEEAVSWPTQWKGNRNQAPSNAQVDPMTLYDRESYEYDNSSQNVIGNGVFEMEEGVTWRPRDGIFQNQYAMPAYLAEEDELGVQQSDMWDSTAGEWRVTQPSASGVPLARKVPKLKTPWRPEVTGPRSHIEAFGRRTAQALLREAKNYRPEHRSQFLSNALEALSPGAPVRARRAAETLIQLGYPQETALEDAVAHLVMHASVKDLTAKRPKRSLLSRLDRMSKVIRGNEKNVVRHAAVEHLQPLAKNTDALRTDLGALYGSPAGHAMGQVAEEPAPSTALAAPGIFRPRNLAIAGVLGAGAYLLFANRKAIAKNVQKWVK